MTAADVERRILRTDAAADAIYAAGHIRDDDDLHALILRLAAHLGASETDLTHISAILDGDPIGADLETP